VLFTWLFLLLNLQLFNLCLIRFSYKTLVNIYLLYTNVCSLNIYFLSETSFLWIRYSILTVLYYLHDSVHFLISFAEEHEHLVDSQGSDWRPLIHTHDLGAFKLGRLPSGRIRCHLQDFCIALSFLLLISLDNHDLSRQDWKFHLQMWHGDNGSELIECFYANQSKVRGIFIDD